MFENFLDIILLLISNSTSLWSEILLCVICILCNLLRLVLLPRILSMWVKVTSALEKNLYSLVAWYNIPKISIRLLWLILFKSSIFLLISSLFVLSITEKGVLKSPTTFGDLSISRNLWCCQFLFHVFGSFVIEYLPS